jgi:molybdopterin-guanine dinucleotide biosynthesis protein A
MSAHAAVILAGGAARRLGGAIKPLLAVGGGATILERQLAALAAAGVTEVALSVGAEVAPELEVAAERHRLALVKDPVAGQGPLGGLAAALVWSPLPTLLCLAGDLPDVAPAVLSLLLAHAAGVDAVVPRIGDAVEPLIAIYGIRCLAAIEARLAGGLRRARELPDALAASGLRVRFVDEPALRAVDPGLISFTNWNRPRDLR